jgi:DNA-binding transcriptional ArsR family regulator
MKKAKSTEVKSPYKKEVYERNAEFWKMMANPKRLEIMNIIKDREVNVDTLSEVIGMRKANTSQHLAILRYLKIVKVRKDGKNSYYKLIDPRIVEPCRILKEIWEH